VRARIGVVLFALVVAGRAGLAAPRRSKPAAEPPAAADAHATTDCAACHVETSWSEFRFDHARTGFPLEGAHGRVTCRGCHRKDFKTALPTTCIGCHRDRHAGQLGLHCEGCHGTANWREVTFFWGDGHRTTAFPLTGKHTTIPCQECHGDMRNRAFSRAPLQCVACHRADYDGAKTRSADHAALGLGTDCQSCHGTWSFVPARFPPHDSCFQLSTGSHRALRCQQCHSTTAGLVFTGMCAATVTCTSCHDHQCARSDQQHQNVPGYACVDQKCYQCHQQDGR
jgi:hypothetical protein